MGNPDIRDIVEHVDQNKNQSLDPKEWKLISELFGAQPKEFKTDIQTTTSGDKFMTDQEKEQITLQEQTNNNIKKENKEIISYNKNIDSLKKSLENPKTIMKLLDMMWSRIQFITKQEDIQYYEVFLNTLKNNIQDKLPSENMTVEESIRDSNDIKYDFARINEKIPNILNSLSQKKIELSQKEIIVNKNIVEKATNTINTQKKLNNTQWNIEWLKQNLNSLESNDILQFKWVVDNLKNWLLVPENVPQFVSMMNVFRSMNGLSKDQIMTVVDTTIDTKFSDKKDGPEMKLFKDTLSAVLDKWLIWKFITKVDEDLNKDNRLKWLSYDVLLDTKTDLSSKEARIAINTIFSRDESLFNKIMTDLKSDKKWQVENIIKEYIKSDFPNQDLSWTIIEIGEVQLQDTEWTPYTKQCFNIMKDGKIVEVSAGKDENGKDKLQKLTPFFWDAKYGKIIPMEQCLISNLMKDVLWKDNLAMPWVANLMKELVTVNGKQLSFPEAITSLFNSPLFDQIKQALYTLMAMFGKEDSQEKAMIESNYLAIKNDVRKWWNLSYKDRDGKDKEISYIDALHKFEPLAIKDWENYKAIFLWASIENQKKYIEITLKDWKDVAYTFLDSIKWKKINSNTTIDESKKPEWVSLLWVEFKNGTDYKELSIDSIKPGKVEKIDTDINNPYFRIDGQVISLIDGKWSLFVKWSDGQIIEKIITITQDKEKKNNISIKDGEKLDMWLLESSNTGKMIDFSQLNNQDGKLFNVLKYQLFNSNAMNDLIASTKNMTPDELQKVENTLVTIQKEIIWLPNNERIKIKDIAKKSFTTLNSIITEPNKSWLWKTATKKWIASIWFS